MITTLDTKSVTSDTLTLILKNQRHRSRLLNAERGLLQGNKLLEPRSGSEVR